MTSLCAWQEYPDVVAELVKEQVIWVDADGNVTDDPAAAVRGEIIRTFDDGTTENTLFTVEGTDEP